VNTILMLIPYRTPLSLYIFQRWVPNFDPEAKRGIATNSKNADAGLKIPTWITLRCLPDEMRDVASQIFAGIGELLGTDNTQSDNSNPKFYIGIPSRMGWE
jgi:hypothetical protein